jgi:hypothetical protein
VPSAWAIPSVKLSPRPPLGSAKAAYRMPGCGGADDARLAEAFGERRGGDDVVDSVSKAVKASR